MFHGGGAERRYCHVRRLHKFTPPGPVTPARRHPPMGQVVAVVR